MSQVSEKPYTKIRVQLALCGVNYKDSGNADYNLDSQVSIEIFDEQSVASVTLYFNISSTGKEEFVCQE